MLMSISDAHDEKTRRQHLGVSLRRQAFGVAGLLPILFDEIRRDSVHLSAGKVKNTILQTDSLERKFCFLRYIKRKFIFEMLHGYRVPEKSVYEASQCSTCTVTYQIHSGHICAIPFCTAVDDNERLQKVAELPEQIRFGNRGVFRNKG